MTIELFAVVCRFEYSCEFYITLPAVDGVAFNRTDAFAVYDYVCHNIAFVGVGVAAGSIAA